jgi:hypothetical protein
MDAVDDQELSCAHVVEFPEDEETSISSEPNTAIGELQEVFGTLLTTDTKTAPVPSYHTWDLWSWRTKYKAPPPLLPEWTGSFKLLSFPREIRDTIYFHYVFRYRGLRYRTNSAITEWSAPAENQMLPLFLTCRQVYEEALRVSCRYNQIEVPRRLDRKLRNYREVPGGLLRLFPEKPRNLVQRIHYEAYYEAERHVTFLQILQDAHTFKAVFPMLREFTADWRARGEGLIADLNIQEGRHEENVQAWLGWFRLWVRKSKVVPPPWVRFQFGCGSGFSPIHEHAGSMNEAYSIMLRQPPTLLTEMMDVEESGKKWIEEMGKEEKRKRKKRSSQ